MLLVSVSQVAIVVKNMPANAGDLKDMGSFPGLGRSPGGGHGNPLQYSCPENPMDKEPDGFSSWGHKESDMTEQLSVDNKHSTEIPNGIFVKMPLKS